MDSVIRNWWCVFGSLAALGGCAAEGMPNDDGQFTQPVFMTGGTGGVGGAAGLGGVGGMAGFAGVGGTGGVAPTGGVGGVIETGGTGGMAGMAGMVGMAGMAGMEADAGPMGTGECCADGDCLCRSAPPSALTSSKGEYTTASYTISTGKVHYPTNAEPPFAAVAVCGGFTNTGPEMDSWGPFYASHGIVTVIVTTLGTDTPDIRATKLLAAITELKGENTKSGSMLNGKLAGRYGTSGYSMGGGGTTIASGTDATLRTSVGLAPWGPNGAGVTVPTLLLCGNSDTTAPCSMATGAYGQIPMATPKMQVAISGATHFNWFGPTDAGMGTSGKYALAFQKVYLEGDERWKSLLVTMPSNGTQTTNIQ